MAADPSDDELFGFASSLVQDLGELLREPSVLFESIRAHRELWVMLFQVSGDTPESEGVTD